MIDTKQSKLWCVLFIKIISRSQWCVLFDRGHQQTIVAVAYNNIMNKYCTSTSITNDWYAHPWNAEDTYFNSKQNIWIHTSIEGKRYPPFLHHLLQFFFSIDWRLKYSLPKSKAKATVLQRNTSTSIKNKRYLHPLKDKKYKYVPLSKSRDMILYWNQSIHTRNHLNSNSIPCGATITTNLYKYNSLGNNSNKQKY